MSTSSYISNYGTVEKTNSGVTTAAMGLKNQASTALLKINGASGVNSCELRFTGVVPNTTTSVIQADGKIQLSHNCELYAHSGYKQDAGTLSVMGAASTYSWARLKAGTDGEVAEINGGSVVLSDGSSYHSSVLTSNMWFKFGGSSSLKFGINEDTEDVDLLETFQVTIFAGAKAILDTTDLDPEFVPFGAWTFVHTADDAITGTFTLDAGTLPYTISKADDDEKYNLDT